MVNRIIDPGTARAVLSAAVLAAGLVVAAAPARAQQPPARESRMQRVDPEQRVERRVQQLSARLQLTEEQVGRVREVLRKEVEERQALLEEMGSRRDQPRDSATRAENRAALREALLRISERTDRELEQVLDSTQLERYRALQREMRERAPSAPRDPGAGVSRPRSGSARRPGGPGARPPRS